MVKFNALILIFILNLNYYWSNAHKHKRDYWIINLKIPIENLNKYHLVLDKHSSLIDEVVKPKHTFRQASNHSKETHSFGVWRIPKDSTLKNDLTNLLNTHNIHFTFLGVNGDKNRKEGLRKRRNAFDLFNPNENWIYLNSNGSDSEAINSENLISKYFSVEQIYDWMRNLTATYNNITELIDIGKSHKNRSLLVFKIGYPNKRTNKVKKSFWFDSGIHSREWTSISTSLYTINEILEEQKHKSSVMHRFLKHFDIYFLAITNVDGYDYSLRNDPFWRKNLKDINETNIETDCFGVDLNRNYDYHWMKTGASSSICSDIYAGEKPNSEPETLAVQNFVLSKVPNLISFVTLHSYGGFWITHFEKNNPSLNKKTFIKICTKPTYALGMIDKKFNYKYQFGIPSKLLNYDASGASDSWAMMMANITYSYTVEIGPLISESLTGFEFSFGFSVTDERIAYIVKRAHLGIKEYLRTFVDKLNKNIHNELVKKCTADYNELISSFSGYWSR